MSSDARGRALDAAAKVFEASGVHVDSALLERALDAAQAALKPPYKPGLPRQKTRAEKLAEQAAGVRYGCHLELEPGQEPDDCVLDFGAKRDCSYARRHHTREACRYWERVDGTVPERDGSACLYHPEDKPGGRW